MRGRARSPASRVASSRWVPALRVGVVGLWVVAAAGCLASVSAGPEPGPATASPGVSAPLASVAPVLVTVAAVPTEGSVPFTVNFSASATGGTGSYILYLWHFGDGHDGEGRSVLYTYGTAGPFNATVSVTDTAGHAGSASITIQARAASTDAPASPTVPLWVAAVLAAILGLMIAWVVVLRRDRLESAVPTASLESPGTMPTPPPPDGRIGGGWTAPPGGLGAGTLRPLSAPAVAEPGTTAEPTRVDPPTSVDPRVTAADAAAAPLTRRVLRHLAGLGPLYENDVAGSERTQGGIATAVDSQQNVISKVLRRLTAAGAITCETRHVKGANRRVKVYSLTPYGESVARSQRVAAGRDPASEPPRSSR